MKSLLCIFWLWSLNDLFAFCFFIDVRFHAVTVLSTGGLFLALITDSSRFRSCLRLFTFSVLHVRASVQPDTCKASDSERVAGTMKFNWVLNVCKSTLSTMRRGCENCLSQTLMGLSALRWKFVLYYRHEKVLLPLTSMNGSWICSINNCILHGLY